MTYIGKTKKKPGRPSPSQMKISVVREDSTGRYSPTTMSSNDVKEATAALKGLLGIGVTIGNGSRKAEKVDDKRECVPSVIPVIQEDKKKKTKKKKNNHQAQPSPTPKQQNHHGRNSRTKKGNAHNGRDRKSSHKKNSSPNRRNSKNPEAGGGTGDPSHANQNFAWSAFQSAPDPSTLPLPAFGSTNPTSGTFSSDQPISAEPTSDTSEVQLVTPSETSPALQSVQEVEEKVIVKLAEETQKKRSTGETSDTSSPLSSTVHCSTSGINLAAHTSPLLKSSPEQDKQIRDPISLLLSGKVQPSQESTTQPVTLFPQAPANSQKSPLPFPPPPQHLPAPYPPPPQNGVITIQVRVPPVLLPGRQMMVMSPAGFPISVGVPNNIRPGMIIPVNVPTVIPYHMNRPANSSAGPMHHPGSNYGRPGWTQSGGNNRGFYHGGPNLPQQGVMQGQQHQHRNSED